MSRYSLRIIVFMFVALLQLLPLAARADQSPVVAVLLSDDLPIYQEPASDFATEFNGLVQQYSLHGTTRDVGMVMDELVATQPSLIMAFGVRAAYAAKMWTKDRQDIPILFAQALNWRHYRLLDNRSNIAGIDMSSAPGSELAYLAMFAPDIKRVGLIASKYTIDVARLIREAAGLFGLEVEVVRVDEMDRFKRSFKKLTRRMDGFIVLRDPLLYDLDNLDWVAGQCRDSRIVCLGRSQQLSIKGLLLTVSPGYRDVALQAASMTSAILSGQLNADVVGVTPPLGSKVMLNMRTARTLKLEISQHALDATTDIVE